MPFQNNKNETIFKITNRRLTSTSPSSNDEIAEIARPNTVIRAQTLTYQLLLVNSQMTIVISSI